MKRLLYLCEFATRSGGENSLLSLLPLLAERYDVSVAAPAGGALAAALEKLGIRHHNWQTRDANGQRRDEVQLREDVLELVQAAEPDLLHANSLSMSRLAGRYRQDLDCPVVAHLRDMLNLSATAIQDIARCDRVLAVSAATREWFVERGMPADKVVTVYNGVDLERFAPQARSARVSQLLGLPADTPLLAGVGQLVQRKGWLELLEAVQLARGQCPHAQLVIIGDRWSGKDEAVVYEQQLRQRTEQPDLRGHVHWLGYRDDLAELLPQFTMLVHAARQEPLGRVLLESAAAGLPVIATDVGGTREIFPSEQAGGLLVPLDDPGSMAVAICRLIEDPELRAELSRLARQNAVSRFSVAQACDAISQQYVRLLAARN
jgi:glycosyltransferase involved in cell wall biosynthesis